MKALYRSMILVGFGERVRKKKEMKAVEPEK